MILLPRHLDASLIFHWPIPLVTQHMGSTAAKARIGGITEIHDDAISVTGPLCGEFTGYRWIPLTKASDAELWCFLWSAPEQTVE